MTKSEAAAGYKPGFTLIRQSTKECEVTLTAQEREDMRVKVTHLLREQELKEHEKADATAIFNADIKRIKGDIKRISGAALTGMELKYIGINEFFDENNKSIVTVARLDGRLIQERPLEPGEQIPLPVESAPEIPVEGATNSTPAEVSGVPAKDAPQKPEKKAPAKKAKDSKEKPKGGKK